MTQRKSPESKLRENVYARGIATGEDEVVIWVYVGSRPAVREADEKETCAVLPLRKLSYSALNDPFRQHIAATRTHVAARDNIHLAKNWINACRHHHTHCHSFQNDTVGRAEMPTRVLEISAEKVRLRCDMANMAPFEYLALSHMWGTNHSQQLRLLEENLSTFKQDVPMRELETSSTFTEAIRVTRELGYRFLWIDSLCIIQDSKADWGHEAARMAIVYGNAVCNIASLFPPVNPRERASGVQPQAASREDPRVWNPCVLRPATASLPSVYVELSQKEGVATSRKDGTWWLTQDKWPLFDRAWTFQEYLLSPRTLLIGHQNLMFQCSQLFYDELLGPIGSAHGLEVDPHKKQLGADLAKSRYFPASLRVVGQHQRRQQQQQQQQKQNNDTPSTLLPLTFTKDYLALVNEYLARKLTFASDRSIAFAGVARAFQHLSQMTYLAGLWAECLPLQLLWYVGEKPEHLIRAQQNMAPGPMPFSPPFPVVVQKSGAQEQQVKKVEAPSWSWFAAGIYDFHHLRLLYDDEDVGAARKSGAAVPGASVVVYSFDEIFWATKPEFRFSAKHPVGAFPGSEGYAEFSGLRITLAVKTRAASVDWAADVAAQVQRLKRENHCADDARVECSPLFEYHSDDLASAGRNTTPPSHAVLALVTEFQVVRSAGRYTVQRCLLGLVLVPGKERGTWNDTTQD
ncbi:HET-domain-containing protein [Stemphylium lycopersici]|nr:HET-domain-containing protein [Stemphylium lycopersici]